MKRGLSVLAGCASIAAWALAMPARADDAITPYVVQRGDTLYDIAGAYLLRRDDYRVVQRRNRITHPPAAAGRRGSEHPDGASAKHARPSSPGRL